MNVIIVIVIIMSMRTANIYLRGWDGCSEGPKRSGWKHLEYKEGINFGQRVAPSILTGGKAKGMLRIGKSLGVVIESRSNCYLIADFCQTGGAIWDWE